MKLFFNMTRTHLLNTLSPPLKKGGRGDLRQVDIKIPLGPPLSKGEVQLYHPTNYPETWS